MHLQHICVFGLSFRVIVGAATTLIVKSTGSAMSHPSPAPYSPKMASRISSIATANHSSAAKFTPRTSASRTASSSSRCNSTVTHTIVITETPTASAITYDLVEGTYTWNQDDYPPVPTFRPTTVYSNTVYTTVNDTVTYGVVATSTATIGRDYTSTIYPPADFLPIQSTLPNVTDGGFGGGNPVQRKRAVLPRKRADECILVTSTLTSTTTLPVPTAVTTVTTLTGVIYAYTAESTTFDAVGLSAFTSTYTPAPVSSSPDTTTATIYAWTQYTTTATLTYTTTLTTTSVYAACATNNIGLLYYIPTEVHNQWLTYDGGVSIGDYYIFDTAYKCCAAAVELGNVGFWTWSEFGCYVTYAATSSMNASSNMCDQRAVNYTATYDNYAYDSDQPEPWVHGNGLCGEITAATPYLKSAAPTS